jgi:hypothetical protein
MTISVRVASAADIGTIVTLNGDVQQLHAELELSCASISANVRWVSPIGVGRRLPRNRPRA